MCDKAVRPFLCVLYFLLVVLPVILLLLPQTCRDTRIATARLPPAAAAHCGRYTNPRLLSAVSTRLPAPGWLLGLSLTVNRLIAASAAGFAMWNINLTQCNTNLRRIKRALMEAAAAHEIGNDEYRMLWERFVIFSTSCVKLNSENKTGCRLAVLSKNKSMSSDSRRIYLIKLHSVYQYSMVRMWQHNFCNFGGYHLKCCNTNGFLWGI